jgi:hypothetical protein
MCDKCFFPRSNNCLYTVDDKGKKCKYCEDLMQTQDYIEQQVWCILLGYKTRFANFYDDDGKLHNVCKFCRAVRVTNKGLQWTQSSIRSS